MLITLHLLNLSMGEVGKRNHCERFIIRSTKGERAICEKHLDLEVQRAAHEVQLQWGHYGAEIYPLKEARRRLPIAIANGPI